MLVIVDPHLIVHMCAHHDTRNLVSINDNQIVTYHLVIDGVHVYREEWRNCWKVIARTHMHITSCKHSTQDFPRPSPDYCEKRYQHLFRI